MTEESKSNTEFVIHVPTEYDYRLNAKYRGPLLNAIKKAYR